MKTTLYKLFIRSIILFILDKEMKEYILIIVLLLIGSNVQAADCNKVTKNELYQFNTDIFIGEVLDSVDVGIRIHESFKGVLKDTIFAKFEFGNIHTKVGSLWLIYAHEVQEDLLIIESCNGSKSFKYPYNIHDDTPFGLPLSITSKESIGLAELILDGVSYNELYIDVINLRQKKMITMLESMKKENAKLIANLPDTSGNSSQTLLWVVISGFLIIIALLLFKLK